MKILVCSLQGRSGAIHYTSQLANTLSKHHEVYALVPSYSNKSLFDKKVKIITMEAPPSIAKTLFLTFKFSNFSKTIRKIKEINPDIIHFSEIHPWYLVFLPYIKKYPIFLSQHDVIPHPGEPVRGKITIAINNIINKRADRIVVHGKMLKNLLVKKGYPESKIIVMYVGAYSFLLKWAKKGVKTEEHNILFFGRILKYKGLDNLLKAMPLIKQKVPDIKLTIAGDGDLSPYKEYIIPEIKDNLEIINKFLDEGEISHLFQKASMVIVPYREASQSGPVIIGYAFKKPLICTNVGAIPEVVDDQKTGILVPPNNPRILAEKVVELIKNDRKRAMLAENGYRKVRDFLNWDVQIRVLVKEYQAMAKEAKNEKSN